MQKKWTLLLLLFWPAVVFGQKIKGHVYEDLNGSKGEPVSAATARYQNSGLVTFTDTTGYFELPFNGHDYLIVEFVGYRSDTLMVHSAGEVEIYLKPDNLLDAAVVRSDLRSSFISHIDPRTTMKLSERELRKAPCCNLSESFETTPSVDVSYSDAITGVKQIKMLGLNSRYALLSRNAVALGLGPDNFYSMEFIPGSWIGQIELSKGVGSVVAGMETVTGHINVGLKSGDEVGKLFLDGYVNEGSRSELTWGTSKKLSKKLQTTLLGNVAAFPAFNDRNNDNFRDLPETYRAVFNNNWRYTGGDWNSIVDLDVALDKRYSGTKIPLVIAGQTRSVPDDRYELTTEQGNFSFTNKTWHQTERKPYQSIGLQSKVSYRMYDSYLFRQSYRVENNEALAKGMKGRLFQDKYTQVYENLIYKSIIGTTEHRFKTGLTYNFMYVDELLGTQFMRNTNQDHIVMNLHTIGAFYEHNWTPVPNFTVIAGIRADRVYDNKIVYSPRANIKYGFNGDKTVIRLSSGLGHRRTFPVSELQNYLYSNRTWEFSDNILNNLSRLPLESGWNHGLSLTHNFRLNLRKGSILADYYYTQFQNRLVADFDLKQLVTSIYYTSGTTQSAHVQIDYELYKRLNMRLAYRWYHALVNFKGGTDQPFYLPPHRLFINLEYETRKKWKFDITAQGFDHARLPNTSYYEASLQRNAQSPRYVLVNFQIRKETKKENEFFFGADNVLDYRQPNVIISSNNISSPQFDATQVWGPIRGRMAYAGFRIKLNKKEKTQ